MQLNREVCALDRPTGSTRADVVRRYILDAIESGDFEVGQRLPSEPALAAQLGVSRPAVREAVSSLMAAGKVRTERGRGTFISDQPPTPKLQFTAIDGIEDLLAWQELRTAVESEAARLAAERHTASDLEDILQVHALSSDAAARGNHAIELESQFHLAIARASHNEVLIDAQRSFSSHIRHWVKTVLERSNYSASDRDAFRYREHQAIVEAIARMDPDGAAAAARRHMLNGRTRLLAVLSIHGSAVLTPEKR